jgi:chaperonin GroES
MNIFWHSYQSSANGPIEGSGRLSRPQKEVSMKFRPLHDRVVIRRAESDTKSKGGIIIPDNAKEKPQEGEVIAVGPGARDESGALIALDVKAGDLILFGKWSGTEVKIGGEDLLIMKEADIMGIIDKSEMGIIEKTGAAKKAA